MSLPASSAYVAGEPMDPQAAPQQTSVPSEPQPTTDTLIGVLFKYVAKGETAKEDLVPLTVKLHHIKDRAEDGKTATAANLMNAFIHQTEAHAGKKTSTQAAQEIVEVAPR